MEVALIETLEKLGITKSYKDEKITQRYKINDLTVHCTVATALLVDQLRNIKFDSVAVYVIAGLVRDNEQNSYVIEQLLETINKLQQRFTEQHNEHLKEMVACNERYVNLTKYYKETHNV